MSTNPSVVYQSDFCGCCGTLLEDGVEHECSSPPGQYCTQCGNTVGHKNICYPDARRREHLPPVQTISVVRKKLRPIWER